MVVAVVEAPAGDQPMLPAHTSFSAGPAMGDHVPGFGVEAQALGEARALPVTSGPAKGPYSKERTTHPQR